MLSISNSGGLVYLSVSSNQVFPVATNLPFFFPLMPVAFDAYPSTTNDMIGFGHQAVGQVAGVSTLTTTNYLQAAGWSVSASGTVQTGRANWTFSVPYGLTNIATLRVSLYDNQGTSTPPTFIFAHLRENADGVWSNVAQTTTRTGTVSSAATWTANSFTCNFSIVYGDRVQVLGTGSFAATNANNTRYQFFDVSKGWRAVP